MKSLVSHIGQHSLAVCVVLLLTLAANAQTTRFAHEGKQPDSNPAASSTAAVSNHDRVVKTLNRLSDLARTRVSSENTSPSALFADWTPTGSDIVYTAGNVGIGTSSPTTILDVVRNQNANTFIRIANNNTGLTGKAYFIADNGTHVVRVQQNGTGFGGFGSTLPGEGVLYSTSPAFTIMSDNVDGILKFATGGADERMRIDASGNVGISTMLPSSTLHVAGTIALDTLGTAGSTALCRNNSNRIASCSSSLRYKTNIAPFSFGLNIVRQLRPIRFEWKQGGAQDLGFGAEDVAAIEPLLVSHNEQGQIEGVKYDRISAVLVNAIKEQQTQIEAQQQQLKRQQALIEGLKQMICTQNPDAAICK